MSLPHTFQKRLYILFLIALMSMSFYVKMHSEDIGPLQEHSDHPIAGSSVVFLSLPKGHTSHTQQFHHTPSIQHSCDDLHYTEETIDAYLSHLVYSIDAIDSSYNR